MRLLLIMISLWQITSCRSVEKSHPMSLGFERELSEKDLNEGLTEVVATKKGSYNYKTLSYGAWVNHLAYQSRFSRQLMVETAVASGLNTLYPVAFRYGCGYFKSDIIPSCHRHDKMPLERFLHDIWRQNPEIHGLVWFERILAVPYGFENTEGRDASWIDKDAGDFDGFQVLDVDNAEVRSFLLTALVEAALIPGVSGVHIDDHLAFPQTYRAKDKLTRFVRYITKAFKDRMEALGRKSIFEISHHPERHALTYHADWRSWPVDRVIVQCYKLPEKIKQGACEETANIYGLGIAYRFRPGGGEAWRELTMTEVTDVYKYAKDRKKSLIIFDLSGLAAHKDKLGPLKALLNQN